MNLNKYFQFQKRGIFNFKIMFTLLSVIFSVFFLPVRAEESVESFLKEIETQGADKLTLEKLAQVHDLNKRLEEVLSVEQKISHIRKLRQDRQGSRETLPYMPHTAVSNPLPVSSPVLPVAGYAVQKVFKKDGLFQAVLLDAKGRLLDVRSGSVLPSGEHLQILSRDKILIVSDKKTQPLPFASGHPSASMRGIVKEPLKENSISSATPEASPSSIEALPPSEGDAS